MNFPRGVMRGGQSSILGSDAWTAPTMARKWVSFRIPRENEAARRQTLRVR